MIPTVLGVYTSLHASKRGAGTTSHMDQQTIYWFIARAPGGEYAAQPLNDKELPSGMVQQIDEEQFFTNYRPEPEYYDIHLRGVANSLREKINGLQTPKEVPELSEEEDTLRNGLLAFVHGSVGNSFSETDLYTLRTMLDSIRQTKNLVMEYQKTITSAAIVLRRNKDFSKAVEYYRRALKVEGQNDHIFFNLARVFFEMGNLKDCREALNNALAKNPELDMARRFLGYLDASRRIEDD